MSTVLSKEVINTVNTHVLGKRIKKTYPGFNLALFDREIASNLQAQTLSERIQQVRKSLFNYLPKDYPTALKILVDSLPAILPRDAFDTKLDLSSQNGFIMIALTSYVARYGIDEYSISMAALKEMTKRFSSEGSIRYFIEKYPDKTLKTFSVWVHDKSPHVRRLVSEGTRPRLPMMMALASFKKDPSPIIPFLEKLKKDPELFVRRSVANNLNDIAKDNPNIVTQLLACWSKDRSSEMQWLVKHALRTLEKQGDPAALKILGFSSDPKVEIKLFELSKTKVVFGDFLTMELRINSKCNKTLQVENLLIDYVVYHKKANGKLAPKVFKWCKKKIAYGETLSLTKKHAFKPISTRKYYPGNHEIHIQINGKILSKCYFELKM